ncbi:MAG: hypothetical protein FWF44_06685, partial [Defluviitaleaceae bacterium]|nr:hypothetical protein [Defluviitaleaceae bacterium]
MKIRKLFAALLVMCMVFSGLSAAAYAAQPSAAQAGAVALNGDPAGDITLDSTPAPEDPAPGDSQAPDVTETPPPDVTAPPDTTPPEVSPSDPAGTPDPSASDDIVTADPTDAPTDTPTDVPSDIPTDIPTDTPTDVPTDTPTDIPTDVPTETPPPDGDVAAVAGVVTPDMGVIEISDAQGLYDIRYNMSGAYALTADIDLSDFMDGFWMPIGGETEAFTGTLDGQGHEIKNLTISGDGYQYAGLFGCTALGSSIKNIRLTDVNIGGDADSTAAVYAGGIAGYSGGDISGCSVSGTIAVKTENQGPDNHAVAGGICGAAYSGSITNSYSAAAVSAAGIDSAGQNSIAAYAGGICGENDGAVISDSYNTGSISADTSTLSQEGAAAYAGGIAGYNAAEINS